jgi:hypothetical protein
MRGDLSGVFVDIYFGKTRVPENDVSNQPIATLSHGALEHPKELQFLLFPSDYYLSHLPFEERHS